MNKEKIRKLLEELENALLERDCSVALEILEDLREEVIKEE